MMEDFEPMTMSEAMETMSEKDLASIAAYSFPTFQTMCALWALELQMKKEGKSFSTLPVMVKSGKSKKGLLSLWQRFKAWLFLRFGKMENLKK
jgi:hypothetical protein